MPAKLKNALSQRIRGLYERGGYSMTEIGEMLDVSTSSVFYHLRKLGVHTRRRGRILGPADPARYKAMQQMRAAGYRFRDIGAKFGISHQAVCQYLARTGCRDKRLIKYRQTLDNTPPTPVS